VRALRPPKGARHTLQKRHNIHTTENTYKTINTVDGDRGGINKKSTTAWLAMVKNARLANTAMMQSATAADGPGS
jgi:hypothetical protein